MKKLPNFRVDKTSNGHRVFLLCSNCSKDVKEIKKDESVNVTRAYYCDECEPNPSVIILNPSTKTTRKK